MSKWGINLNDIISSGGANGGSSPESFGMQGNFGTEGTGDDADIEQMRVCRNKRMISVERKIMARYPMICPIPCHDW